MLKLLRKWYYLLFNHRANNTPVWVTSASIDCDTFTDCFSGCFRNPEEGDDLSNSCFPSEDVYLIKNSQAVKKGVRPLKRLW